MKKILVALTLVLVLAAAAVPVMAAGDEPELAGRALRQGTVVEIGEGQFVVLTRTNELTVLVDGDTQYRMPGVDTPSLDALDALRAGDRVVVYGRKTIGDELLARLVVRIPPRNERGGLRGELVATSDESLELLREADGRTITVLVDGDTRYRVAGVEEPGLADLTLGDAILAEGTWDTDGRLHAHLVALIPEGIENSVRGEVTAVGDAHLSILSRRGPVDVLVSAETGFRVPGVEETTLADIQVGDQVLAGGVLGADGLEAVTVAVISDALPRGQRHGEVSANTGDSLTLETAGGPVTVLVGENTRVRVAGVEGAALADVEVGFKAAALGGWDRENGTLRAWLVVARPVLQE